MRKAQQCIGITVLKHACRNDVASGAAPCSLSRERPAKSGPKPPKRPVAGEVEAVMEKLWRAMV